MTGFIKPVAGSALWVQTHRSSCLSDTVLVIRTTEIRELLQQLRYDLQIHRSINPVGNRDIAGVEALLPLTGQRDDQIAANQLTPVGVAVVGIAASNLNLDSLARGRVRRFS